MDSETGTPVGPEIETGTEVFSVEVASVDEVSLLFAAGADEIVRAWDMETGESISLSARGVVISALSRSDGTMLLAVGTTRGEMTIYECALSNSDLSPGE
ncbi:MULTISPECIES: hypothetical protein [unclassified Streptomyces]|uniref:hypothetical protein n=1 Tax=unclassified Streptomyces TaxID=2593676 RepID=UPI0036E7B0C3